MTEYTRPATWDDLRTVIDLLNDADVEFALIGGYALAVHGFNRFTEDVDILVNPAPLNTKRWIEALSKLPDGAARELEGEEDIFQKEGPYTIRINDVFTVDVLPAACGRGWQDLKRHVVEIRLDDAIIPVLDLEGLLLTKEGMRERDRADSSILREAILRRKG